MKPELANLFAVNTTGQHGDFLLSFFYEWHNTEDGKSAEVNRQKVASVVLTISDFLQLAETLSNVKTQLEEMNSQLEDGIELNPSVDAIAAWEGFKKYKGIIPYDIDEKAELAGARDKKYAGFN